MRDVLTDEDTHDVQPVGRTKCFIIECCNDAQRIISCFALIWLKTCTHKHSYIKYKNVGVLYSYKYVSICSYPPRKVDTGQVSNYKLRYQLSGVSFDNSHILRHDNSMVQPHMQNKPVLAHMTTSWGGESISSTFFQPRPRMPVEEDEGAESSEWVSEKSTVRSIWLR